ncbi:MAG: hypothetical protein AAF502_07145 [Bacteroidota bacterium]
MNKFLILLSLFLFPQIGFGQDTLKTKGKAKKMNHARVAAQQIQDLHDGVLLVRLKTKSKTIEALREAGMHAQADKRQEKLNKTNRSIILAFNNYFDFCPTYFFFSHFSDHIRAKEFDKVEFVNRDFEVDTTIKLDGKTIFTAEFGPIEQDQDKYFEGYYLSRDENGLERKEKVYGSPNPGFEALLIKDDQFVQLRDPFPFYVKKTGMLVVDKDARQLVNMMNKKLKRFYGQ